MKKLSNSKVSKPQKFKLRFQEVSLHTSSIPHLSKKTVLYFFEIFLLCANDDDFFFFFLGGWGLVDNCICSCA